MYVVVIDGSLFSHKLFDRRSEKRDCYANTPRVGALSDDARLMSDVCLSVAHIGPKSRTERPRKTKIGTEVGHVVRDSDTTFKVKRSKAKLQGAGAYCVGFPHSLLTSCLSLRCT